VRLSKDSLNLGEARGSSGFGRFFWVAVLVLGLLIGAAMPLRMMVSAPRSVSADNHFKPSMRVSKYVDADGNRIDDRLDLEIGQRISNRTEMEPVNVVVLLSVDAGEGATAAFRALGGLVTTGLWSRR
jgi:hypothetical protein